MSWGLLGLCSARSDAALETFFRRKVIPQMETAVPEEEIPFHPELGGLVAAWKSAHKLEVQTAWHGQENRCEETNQADIRRAKEVERAKNSKRMTEEEVTKYEEKFVRKYPGETTGML